MSGFFVQSFLADSFLFAAGGVADKLWPNYTFFLQTFFFLVCFLLLKNYLFPPVLHVLLERQRMVDQAHQEFKRFETEGQDMEQEYRERIRQARAEAQQIHKTARSEASEQERHLVESARTEAQQILQQREAQARQQREVLRQSLDQESDVMAKDIASKVLGRSV